MNRRLFVASVFAMTVVPRDVFAFSYNRPEDALEYEGVRGFASAKVSFRPKCQAVTDTDNICDGFKANEDIPNLIDTSTTITQFSFVCASPKAAQRLAAWLVEERGSAFHDDRLSRGGKYNIFVRLDRAEAPEGAFETVWGATNWETRYPVVAVKENNVHVLSWHMPNFGVSYDDLAALAYPLLDALALRLESPIPIMYYDLRQTLLTEDDFVTAYPKGHGDYSITDIQVEVSSLGDYFDDSKYS